MVLSAHPLLVPTEAVNEIEVLVTTVGGIVRHCAPGAEALCPAAGG